MTRRERIVEWTATGIGLAIAAPILAAMWTYRGITWCLEHAQRIRRDA